MTGTADPDDRNSVNARATAVDARTVGNQWMVSREGDVTRYMSDQWRGRVFGYEMRESDLCGDVHFAQSSPYVLGVLGVGGGNASVNRGVENRYGWHHLSQDYTAAEVAIGPAALSQAILAQVDAKYLALELFCDRGVLWGSGLRADLNPGRSRPEEVAEAVRDMQAWAEHIGKSFLVDCISLSLMEAETARWPSILYEYGVSVRRLRDTVMKLTGQTIPPQFIISQHAGTRSDGASNSALAEAGAMIDLWGLDVTIATPKYHLPIEAGSASRLTPASARYVSEMEAHAHLTRRAGKQWFCPLMTLARLEGNLITASFTLGDAASLVLEDAQQHGFTLSGPGARGLNITGVKVRARMVQITLNHAPKDQIQLCYAWGQTRDGAKDLPANRGSLRDDWSAASNFDPGVTLHRYALSQRVSVTSMAQPARKKS